MQDFSVQKVKRRCSSCLRPMQDEAHAGSAFADTNFRPAGVRSGL